MDVDLSESEEEEKDEAKESEEVEFPLEDLPPGVTKTELKFLVRKRPRSNMEEPRLTLQTIQLLGWTLQDAYVKGGVRGLKLSLLIGVRAAGGLILLYAHSMHLDRG